MYKYESATQNQISILKSFGLHYEHYTISRATARDYIKRELRRVNYISAPAEILTSSFFTSAIASTTP